MSATGTLLLGAVHVDAGDFLVIVAASAVAGTLLFLVVRGTPALLLYRAVPDRRERLALALFTSPQLPLVLAITTLTRETGHMRASTAASLVGAAVRSTLVFPILGLRLRGRAPVPQADVAEATAPA